jgi:hypothetical protein
MICAFPPGTTFISFDHRAEDYGHTTYKIRAYLTWLKQHGAERTVHWEWQTADTFASGIFIFDTELAVMFKLAFAT